MISSMAHLRVRSVSRKVTAEKHLCVAVVKQLKVEQETESSVVFREEHQMARLVLIKS